MKQTILAKRLEVLKTQKAELFSRPKSQRHGLDDIQTCINTVTRWIKDLTAKGIYENKNTKLPNNYFPSDKVGAAIIGKKSIAEHYSVNAGLGPIGRISKENLGNINQGTLVACTNDCPPLPEEAAACPPVHEHTYDALHYAVQSIIGRKISHVERNGDNFSIAIDMDSPLRSELLKYPKENESEASRKQRIELLGIGSPLDCFYRRQKKEANSRLQKLLKFVQDSFTPKTLLTVAVETELKGILHILK